MNIIFADWDGVFNCEMFYLLKDYPKNIDNYEVENTCSMRLKWLADLCKDTNSKVVISSSWRMGRRIEDFYEIFEKLNVDGIEIIGMTPILHISSYMGKDNMPSIPRGVEIKYWLDNTNIQYNNFCIIDDDADMLLEQAPHFFQTDPYAGLTPYTCQRIRDFFSKNGK